ncbi:hypothetical protein CHUAL_002138 [Chamberlinius hualienensis]
MLNEAHSPGISDPLMYTYPFGYVTGQDNIDNDVGYADPIKSVTDGIQSMASANSFSSLSTLGTGAEQPTSGTNTLSFSAIGLLGFLFFLRLIQDTLDILNNTTFGSNINSLGGKRSRRSKSNYDVDWITMADNVYQFYQQISREKNPVCRQKSLCQVNIYLIEKYHRAGNAMGMLLSNIIDEMKDEENESKANWTDANTNPKNCQLYTQFCQRDEAPSLFNIK